MYLGNSPFLFRINKFNVGSIGGYFDIDVSFRFLRWHVAVMSLYLRCIPGFLWNAFTLACLQSDESQLRGEHDGVQQLVQRRQLRENQCELLGYSRFVDN